MNDKPGGTPSPFSFAPAPESGPNPNSSANAAGISPSNFGARPAPTPVAPVPVTPGPTPSTMGTPTPEPIPAPIPTSAATVPTGNPSPSIAPAGPASVTPAATAPATAGPANTAPLTAPANSSQLGDTKSSTSAAPTAAPAATPSASNPFLSNPAVSTAAAPAAPATPGAVPGASTTPAAGPVSAAVDSTPVSPATPDAASTRPMEQVAAPVEAPTKPKSKLPLIIGLVATGVVAIVGIIIAVVLNLNQTNPVLAAIDKLMSGEAPSNLEAKGEIKNSLNDVSGLLSRYNVSFDAKVIPSSLITDANITLSFGGEHFDDVPLDFGVRYAGNDQLYFKMSGMSNMLESLIEALENMPPTQTVPTTDEDEDEDKEGSSTYEEESDEDLEGNDYLYYFTDESPFSIFIDLLEPMDGEWINISLDSDEEDDGGAIMPDENTSGIDTESFSCAAELGEALRSNRNTLTDIYRKSPFISATDENVTVVSKNFPVYKVTLDSNLLNTFLVDVNAAHIFDRFDTCNDGKPLTTQLSELPSQLPTLYVEVDGDYNFSRLYWSSQSDNAITTVDISFSYPKNITVSDPAEYTSLEDVIMNWINNAIGGEGFEEVDPGEDPTTYDPVAV